MASSRTLKPVPVSPEVIREDSVTPPEYKPKTSTPRMLKIQSLLNPTPSHNSTTQYTVSANSNQSTPATIAYLSSASSTPRPTAPNTTYLSKRTKFSKEAATFTHGSPTGQVNYPTYRSTDKPICLSEDDLKELSRQHKLFKINSPAGDGDGPIGNHTRYIPYSSEKRDFHGKTGRDGFNVYEYTFRVPNAPDQKMWTVLWDYNTGLTRTTPFFKACEYSKTIPKKAVSVNPGLEDLAISTTGGSIGAQGYWMPYECARAICLTFCYNIRWALTPIFGPSFVRECLKPDDPNFGRFKIDPEIVRIARLDAQGWMQSPIDSSTTKEIPRSVPQEYTVAAGKELRPRIARPTFKAGSPFESDGDDSSYSASAVTTIESPGISPKTSVHQVFRNHGWTSINSRCVTTSTPHNTPVDSLNTSLLTQPRYCPWRPADLSDVDENISRVVKMPTGAHDRSRVPKRRRSSAKVAYPDTEYKERHSGSDAGESSSESDDVDIDFTRPVRKKRANRGRMSRPGTRMYTAATPAISLKGEKSVKSTRFTPADFRAATALLKLSDS